jgi:hypothetical protein
VATPRCSEHQRGAIVLRQPAELLVESRVQLVALQTVAVDHRGRLRFQTHRHLPP